MPKIIVTEPFRFAHHGYQVEEFTPSPEPIDTTDECAELAVREGWAKWLAAAATAPVQAPARKAKAAAPATANPDAAAGS